MGVLRFGLALATCAVALSACSGSSTPDPNPAAPSFDARADFVGTWSVNANDTISIRDDGSFSQPDCNTSGGSWNFRKSDQTIALEYKIGTALGCASSDFELARTGFIRGKTLVLENALKGATKAHQQFVLTRE